MSQPLNQLTEADRFAELEKTNRVLQKQLDRAKADQQRLEVTNQQKESLLRRVIEEVKASQFALEARSQELEQALTSLQRTQSQLVQSEKMSSLPTQCMPINIAAPYLNC
jgi:two-component system, NtrC family, sensor kinase